jgi:hypothetical protein
VQDGRASAQQRRQPGVLPSVGQALDVHPDQHTVSQRDRARPRESGQNAKDGERDGEFRQSGSAHGTMMAWPPARRGTPKMRHRHHTTRSETAHHLTSARDTCRKVV